MGKTVAERKAALAELASFVKSDVKATMEALDGLPITIRLLNPPLHEFVPQSQDKLQALAKELKIDMGGLNKRAEGLRENNPMLGHPRRAPWRHVPGHHGDGR